MTPRDIRDRFIERFGQPPTVLSVAPGRVNLIGEHTDYSDGFVFPAAIDRLTYVAARPTDGFTRLHSEILGDCQPFDANTITKEQISGWGAYPAGMAWTLRTAGERLPNLNAYVSSTIPIGSGVSSSAAIEMAFGLVWNKLGTLGVAMQDLAEEGKICENQFVGVNSGIMDQMASALGKAGQAMFLDTRNLAIQYSPMPDGIQIVLCDTKKTHSHGNSGYNDRRNQVEEAARQLGVAKLRDANLPLLESQKSRISDVVYRRGRHVITENKRCIDFKQALDSGNLDAMGALMKQSHLSLRDDFEVSTPELDEMANAAWFAPGCVGARMMGGGFGGACIALVKSAQVKEFIETTLTKFRQATGTDGEAMSCTVVDGARLVDLPKN